MTLIANTGSSTNIPSELGGAYKILSLNNLKMDAASSTIELSAASNGISTIQNVIVTPADPNATFTYASASFSSLVITVTAAAQAGGAATTFGSVNLLVIGT